MIFIIIVPYLGVFVYLIARGHKMHEHAVAERQGAGRSGPAVHPAAVERRRQVADELARLADLKDKGVIDDAEFQRLKAKALA